MNVIYVITTIPGDFLVNPSRGLGRGAKILLELVYNDGGALVIHSKVAKSKGPARCGPLSLRRRDAARAWRVQGPWGCGRR